MHALNGVALSVPGITGVYLFGRVGIAALRELHRKREETIRFYCFLI
jgi:hypothetical protein